MVNTKWYLDAITSLQWDLYFELYHWWRRGRWYGFGGTWCEEKDMIVLDRVKPYKKLYFSVSASYKY